MRAILGALALLAMVGTASAQCTVFAAHGPAGYVNIRRTPGLDGYVIHQLDSPAHVEWCGRETIGSDGKVWSWVGYGFRGQSGYHWGWISDTLLSPAD